MIVRTGPNGHAPAWKLGVFGALQFLLLASCSRTADTTPAPDPQTAAEVSFVGRQ